MSDFTRKSSVGTVVLISRAVKGTVESCGRALHRGLSGAAEVVTQPR